MDLNSAKAGFVSVLAFCFALTVAAPCHADGHRESGRHVRGGYGQIEERHGGAGGATGQIAAWLFGIANFPAALSILLKACGKMTHQSSDLKETLSRINRKQKRYLMKVHYWLNPVAVVVAIIHFLSTECKATAIPEIGLGVMLLVSILGIIVSFRWSPEFMRKAAFRFHTSPVSLIAGITTLLIGHSMVD